MARPEQYEYAIGEKYGMLTVINPKPIIFRSNHYKIACQCDCGKYCEYDKYSLRRAKNPNCGCMIGIKSVPETGKRYGNLTALYKSKTKKRYWCFRCECGREKEIFAYNVVRGHVKTCGNCDGMVDFKHPIPNPYRKGDDFEFMTAEEIKKKHYVTRTNELKNLAKESKEAGMTYGKYVAMKMMKGDK